MRGSRRGRMRQQETVPAVVWAFVFGFAVGEDWFPYDLIQSFAPVGSVFTSIRAM